MMEDRRRPRLLLAAGALATLVARAGPALPMRSSTMPTRVWAPRCLSTGSMPSAERTVCRMRIARQRPCPITPGRIDLWPCCSTRRLGLFAADPGVYRRSPA